MSLSVLYKAVVTHSPVSNTHLIYLSYMDCYLSCVKDSPYMNGSYYLHEDSQVVHID